MADADAEVVAMTDWAEMPAPSPEMVDVMPVPARMSLLGGPVTLSSDEHTVIAMSGTSGLLQGPQRPPVADLLTDYWRRYRRERHMDPGDRREIRRGRRSA